MEVKCVAAIRFLNFEAFDRFEFKGVKFKKLDRERIDSLLGQDLMAFMGKLDLYQLHAGNSIIAYCEYKSDIQPATEEEFSDSMTTPTEDFVGVVDALVNGLWMVKDNSVHISFIYSEGVFKGEKQYTRYKRPPENSTSRGHYLDTSFTEEDLQNAVKAAYLLYKVGVDYNEHEILRTKNKKIKHNPDKSSIVTEHYNFDSRIERAMAFSFLARAHYYLIHKIAMYTVALECLFSTDNVELSHKISERASFYVSTNDAQRKSAYKIAKDAYNIRSRYFHGTDIDYKLLEGSYLEQLSEDIDSILKMALYKIIFKDYKVFFQDDGDLDKSFLAMTFSDGHEPVIFNN